MNLFYKIFLPILLIISLFKLLTFFENNIFKKHELKEEFFNDLYQTENNISHIPNEDLEKIKNLFECLFKFNELGFTLFGDRALSFCSGININLNLLQTKNIVDYVSIIFLNKKSYKQEWKTWQKYKHLFNIKNYILINDKVGVLLINKKKFIKVINQNKNIFNKILGEKFDAELLIQEIYKTESIFKVLKENHELLGILLGFGSHNSKIFQVRSELIEKINLSKIPHDLKKNCSNSQFFDIQQEINQLEQNLESSDSFAQFFILCGLNRVTFVADPTHEETNILRKKYDSQRKQIQEVFLKENWFELLISQLIS